MDAYECVAGKLDIREFDTRQVPNDVKIRILESARLTGSGMNNQHWRFILVQDRGNLEKLAQDSSTGNWVRGASFAVIVLTNPRYGFHLIDAGRAVQDMQITAWNYGVVSCIFTGINREAIERDFSIPKEMSPSVVVGFGYPVKKIRGKKNRKPLRDLFFLEQYGNHLDPDILTGK